MPLIPVSLFWGGRLGGLLIMGTKECAYGIQNISSWFLVWAGAGNHTGVPKDHLYPPIFPGIAFSKPLKWELIPQSSRSRWEQRKNIHERMERAQCELQMSPHCCWLWDTALEFSVFPKQTQFQTEIIDFLPFLPSQWEKEKKKKKAGFGDF